jgi:hypothetical protein
LIVVVASCHDQSAKDIVACWANQDVAILTCEDLSRSGWRHYSDDAAASTAVVAGQIVPFEQITGVLTRRPCVFEEELLHILPADRTYVASEMNAFLLSWLASLSCPVLNRPTATCLSGPNWRPEQWIATAAASGLPVRPAYRYISYPTNETQKCGGVEGEEESGATELTELTLVGDQCFGEGDELLVRRARRLAIAANVDLLGVRFYGRNAGAAFGGVNLWPDLSDGRVAQAVLMYLQGGTS